MEALKAPVALYVAEESYGARPVSGFADAPGRRDDIVAYADDSNLVTHPLSAMYYSIVLDTCDRLPGHGVGRSCKFSGGSAPS